MAGTDLTFIALIALVAISAGGIAWVVLFQRLETDRKTESRVGKVKAAETDRARMKAARDRVQELSRRRKSVQDSLRELEKKQQEKSRNGKEASLQARLIQAGLSITPTRFYMLGGAMGLAAMFLTLLAQAPLMIIPAVGFVIAIGLPRWILGFLIGRRQKKFLSEFPNALDVMCRSIRSGLPLNDAIRLIAADGQEPVRGEFRRVVDSQQLGIGIPEAISRMMNTMPLPEVNFFSVVVGIQAQAGGNLSEALGNLARVLRERKKMRAKVTAVSMEAKASAGIIGSLPFIVALLVYLTSPDYITILFTDTRGHIVLGFSAIWMSMGILVMRNMINFDI